MDANHKKTFNVGGYQIAQLDAKMKRVREIFEQEFLRFPPLKEIGDYTVTIRRKDGSVVTYKEHAWKVRCVRLAIQRVFEEFNPIYHTRRRQARLYVLRAAQYHYLDLNDGEASRSSPGST